jgi:hypothetical protein
MELKEGIFNWSKGRVVSVLNLVTVFEEVLREGSLTGKAGSMKF